MTYVCFAVVYRGLFSTFFSVWPVLKVPEELKVMSYNGWAGLAITVMTCATNAALNLLKLLVQESLPVIDQIIIDKHAGIAVFISKGHFDIY